MISSEHRLERVREDGLAEGADREGRDRDAELHRRDELRRVARDPAHSPRPPVPLMLELEDPGPARRDEAVLGCHEERVQQNQARKGEQFEDEAHGPGPLSGARGLGGTSSSKRIATNPSRGVGGLFAISA